MALGARKRGTWGADGGREEANTKAIIAFMIEIGSLRAVDDSGCGCTGAGAGGSDGGPTGMVGGGEDFGGATGECGGGDFGAGGGGGVGFDGGGGVGGDFGGVGGAGLGVGVLGGGGIGFGDGAGPGTFGSGAPQFPTETLIEQAFGRPAARFMSTSIPILIASSRAAQRHSGLNFTTLDTPSQQSLSGWLWLLPLVTYGKQSIMSMTTLSQSTDDVGSQEEEETAAAERAKVERRDSTHTRLAIVVVVVEEEEEE